MMTFERAFKRSRRRWPSAWPPPRCGAGLYLILQQRGADMADLPGGASGLLVLDYRGKDADRLVTRIDPGRGLAARRTPRPRAPGGRGVGPVEDRRRGSPSPSTRRRRRSPWGSSNRPDAPSQWKTGVEE